MTAEPPISEREREILRLVAMGATNQQIAQQLDISINTVKVHLRNIFGKIGVASRTEATVYAIRQGLVAVDLRPTPEAPLVAVAEPADQAPDSLVSVADDGAQDAEQVLESPPVERAPAPARLLRRWVLAIGFVALALGLGAVAYFLRPQASQPGPAPTAAAASPADRWRTRSPLPRPRPDFAVAAFEGRLFAIGGGSEGAPSAAVDRYDPTNDLWVALNDKPTAASHIKAAAIGRFIYVPGGEASDGVILDVLEAYDPRSQRWERLPSMPAPRSRYALASLEGRLYLFGGWDGSRYCDEVFVYDPEARVWSSDEEPLPTPRRSPSAGVAEGRIYVVGGENERGALRVNERYDPTGDSGRRWESAAPLTDAMAEPAAVGIVNVTLVVFDPMRRGVLQYTPATDSWAAVAIPDDIAISSGAVFLGSNVYVFGEQEDTAQTALSEYQAIISTFLPGVTGNP
jgi:DNA-binding CsgD family transcriptional regulator